MRAIAILGMVAISCAGCAMEEGDEAEQGDGDGAVDEARDAASDQPVTLPYTTAINIASGQTIPAHPFHVLAGALVSVAIEASWSHGCKWPYYVTLRDKSMLGGTLQDYKYASGTIHTEHWKIPSTGSYSVEITIPGYTGCLPFKGSMTITSP
jgi:hypothetical protein